MSGLCVKVSKMLYFQFRLYLFGFFVPDIRKGCNYPRVHAPSDSLLITCMILTGSCYAFRTIEFPISDWCRLHVSALQESILPNALSCDQMVQETNSVTIDQNT